MFHRNTPSIVAVAVFLSCHLALGQAPGALKITVITGDGTVNNVRNRKPLVPVVKVEDSNGKAVQGAKVTFQTPGAGASATFKRGGPGVSVITGPDGQAAAEGFRPNTATGQFQIQVTAEYQGRRGSTQLMQTNAVGAANQKKRIGKGAIIIIVVVAIGAAFGIKKAASSGSK